MYCRATIIQHQQSRVGQPQVGSVALPAVLRAGETPTSPVTAGNAMQKAQYTHISMQAHQGHAPMSVSHPPSLSMYTTHKQQTQKHTQLLILNLSFKIYCKMQLHQ